MLNAASKNTKYHHITSMLMTMAEIKCLDDVKNSKQYEILVNNCAI